MPVEIVPLTPARWPLLEALFGKRGAVSGCWCLYFVQPRPVWKSHTSAGNRSQFRKEVAAGPPPGLLAVEGGKALGWMRIGPRAAVPRWNAPQRSSAPPDPADAEDAAVWAISCFVVARPARGRGLMHLLVGAGVEFARRNGARAVDACPIAAGRKVGEDTLFVGAESVFLKAGFRRIALKTAGRPLLRMDL